MGLSALNIFGSVAKGLNEADAVVAKRNHEINLKKEELRVKNRNERAKTAHTASSKKYQEDVELIDEINNLKGGINSIQGQVLAGKYKDISELQKNRKDAGKAWKWAALPVLGDAPTLNQVEFDAEKVKQGGGNLGELFKDIVSPVYDFETKEPVPVSDTSGAMPVSTYRRGKSTPLTEEQTTAMNEWGLPEGKDTLAHDDYWDNKLTPDFMKQVKAGDFTNAERDNLIALLPNQGQLLKTGTGYQANLMNDAIKHIKANRTKDGVTTDTTDTTGITPLDNTVTPTTLADAGSTTASSLTNEVTEIQQLVDNQYKASTSEMQNKQALLKEKQGKLKIAQQNAFTSSQQDKRLTQQAVLNEKRLNQQSTLTRIKEDGDDRRAEARNQITKDKMLEQQLKDITNIYEQSVKSTAAAWVTAHDKLNEYFVYDPKADTYIPIREVPGYGDIEGALPNWLTSDEGQEVRQAISSFKNPLLKLRSGAAVTATELERLNAELGEGFMVSEERLMYGLKLAREIQLRYEVTLLAGFSDEAVQTWYNRQGKRAPSGYLREWGKIHQTIRKGCGDNQECVFADSRYKPLSRPSRSSIVDKIRADGKKRKLNQGTTNARMIQSLEYYGYYAGGIK